MRWVFAVGLLGLLGCNFASAPAITLVAVPVAIQLVRHDSIVIRVNAVDDYGHLVTGVAVSFSSADTNIVTVSQLGMARAKAQVGSTTIHVRGGGAERAIPVTVRGIPSSIIVSPADTTILQHDSVRLTASVLDERGDSIPGLSVVWQWSDSAAAQVNPAGVARSLGPSGTIEILAGHGTVVGRARITVRDTTILGRRVTAEGRPYGAAISPNGVAYVTTQSRGRLDRADLPSQVFVPAVNVGSIPAEVAFNSRGTVAYVTNYGSHDVAILEVASNSVTHLIPVTGNPYEVIVAPGDSIIYVSTNINRVYAIRVSTRRVVDSFPTPGIGNGMLIRDTLLYVSTHRGGTVIEFNLRTRTVARIFAVGGIPQKMAISPDGNTLYIANQSGYVQFWNRISGKQIRAVALTPAGSAGYGIALRPTNGKLYVTSAYFGGGNIYVIDPVSQRIIDKVQAGGSTRHVVFAADGTGFVPNENGWVDFIK